MNKNITTKTMGNLSLLLVLSYLILHNIYIVFAGILIAISIIQIDFIHSFITYFIKKKSNEDNERTVNLIETCNEKAVSDNEVNVISLVETIEESGFIPSIKKDDDSKAA